MKVGGREALSATARAYGPLLVLLALAILVARAPGSGLGFAAGLVLALAGLLHALIFGAGAARRAAPPTLLRIVLGLGLLLSLAGLAAEGRMWTPQLREAGLFLATASGAMLVAAALIGRASTLDETMW